MFETNVLFLNLIWLVSTNAVLAPLIKKLLYVVPLRSPNSISKRLRSQSRERIVVVSAPMLVDCNDNLGDCVVVTVALDFIAAIGVVLNVGTLRRRFLDCEC